jgi:hypothetical protein
MASSAEGKAVVERPKSRRSSDVSAGSWIARSLLVLALMLLAGNSFLKYLWWTAKSSALAGIPKVATQWQAAVSRATFYGWSLVLLEIVSVFILFGLIHFQSIDSSRLRISLSFISSIVITILGTAILALILSWIQQAMP